MRAFARAWLPLIVLLAAAAPAGAATRRQGTVTLHRCTGEPGWCGAIHRPLDPGLADGPTIPIGFEWVPARAGSAGASTIVAVEGGPGYPSSGTISEYLGTFGPVLGHHNLLLVDNRGTGRSALIRCRSLQRFPKPARASGPLFARIVGACGGALDHRWRGPGGRFIHAADLFATAYATADMRAVLRRLQTGRVELYGDSYGSWFAQAYASRYPGSLRGVILDSTYPITGLDPWYASSGLIGRAAMNRVCARDPGCRADAGSGTPVSRLGRLLTRLRRRPIRGSVPAVGGSQSITLTPRHLVDLVQNGGSDPLVWRELDAAVRAALAGDPTPLLRLEIYDNGNGGDVDPIFFSDGAYMAISCTDYPQLFSMAATPAQRVAQLAASLRSGPANAFRPFTDAEWLTMSGYSETYDSCLDWPAPVHHAPVLGGRGRVGAHPLPASVPMLVVGGDVDDLTPLHDALRFAPGLGRRVRIVDLHNTVHVTSEGDTFLSDGAACARRIMDRFSERPASLETLDTSCASHIPHIQTPGAYPRTLAGARGARVVSGSALGVGARRAVTIAAGALADATIRQTATGDRRGAGLRGGRWIHHGSRFALHAVRFVTDATVSGTGRYRFTGGVTRGKLTVRAHGLSVRVDVAWNQRSQRARARVATTRLTLPAP
jgi:pimeloyl-ACP methyl ester carboxylesterase